MQGFAVLIYVILFGLASAPVIGVTAMVLRASQDIIDTAIILLVAGVLLLALGVALAQVIRALAEWRLARYPLPTPASHTIHVDKSDQRRVAVLISPHGAELPMPPDGQTMAVQELLSTGWQVIERRQR